MPPAGPLFVWTVWLRIVGIGITPDTAHDVNERLHRYNATTRHQDGELTVRVRIVGYEGPASAVGDAQQATLFEAARAGIRSARVEVAHARRVTAS